MPSRTPSSWTVACLVGFGLLFVAFSPGGLALRWFWPETWPEVGALAGLDPAVGSAEVDPEIVAGMYWMNAVYHLVHITLFGALIGWLQARVLPAPAVHRGTWVLLTALGFVSIFLFEAFRPGIVTGGHPAPAEPLMIGVVGGGLAGVYQHLYLRSRGIVATRWLALWIAGLCGGAAVAALLLTLVGFLGPFVRSVLSENQVFVVGQLVFYLLYGPTVGAVAGLASGRALIRSLSHAPERSAA